MHKIVRKILQGSRNRSLAAKLANLSKEKNACQILITCSEPNSTGDMNVDMTYEGDPTLAAYLIESAQNHIVEEEIDE